MSKKANIITTDGTIYSRSDEHDMISLGYDENEFKKYLLTPQQQFKMIDLSNSSLLDVIETYISEKENILKNTRSQLSPYIKKIKQIEAIINKTIMPNMIDDKFWSVFISFCIRNCELSPSSVQPMVTMIIKILSWASNYKCKLSSTYNVYHLFPSNFQQVALTEGEVHKIYNFDFNNLYSYIKPERISKLEKVRDTFLIQCNLGLRVSDVKHICPQMFSKNIFRTPQQKTGKIAQVDIKKLSIDFKMITDILKKYNYRCPDINFNSYNKDLKEIMYYIGIDSKVKLERKICGNIETKIALKYNLICSHTGRRTFCTINSLRGFTDTEVMKASGHVDQKSYNRYVITEQNTPTVVMNPITQ